ncbi:hypothetical protein HMPREF3224_01957 [Anaerococcus hydrogenalis]|nr:hypothetical protein HMPREF3224_01957 [Anaerococcus hydrogenalis]
MIVRLYYDDCRHYSDEDYPCKIIKTDNVNDFWDDWYCDDDVINCSSENSSYLQYLRKDRVIEIWIGEEE